jgi:hypothetical protein
MVEGVNLRHMVSTFVNVTVYPQYNNNILIKSTYKVRRNRSPNPGLGFDSANSSSNTISVPGS